MVDKFETDLYSEYDGIFVFPMVGGIVHCKQMCDVFTFYFPIQNDTKPDFNDRLNIKSLRINASNAG